MSSRDEVIGDSDHVFEDGGVGVARVDGDLDGGCRLGRLTACDSEDGSALG